jgi:hypothetical protein
VTISFSMSAGELVARAMQKRRALALGRTPSAREMDYGLERLNHLLKQLAADGSIPWAVEEATATITAGDPDVLLDPEPAEVVSVGLALTATNERALAPWEVGQYDVLPNKASVGDPVSYVVRETADGVTLRFWPVPSVNRTINYRYVRIPEDVEQASPLDLPQRYIGPIEAVLAWKLDVFANGNPDLPIEAARAEAWLIDQARPDSYFMEPACA